MVNERFGGDGRVVETEGYAGGAGYDVFDRGGSRLIGGDVCERILNDSQAYAIFSQDSAQFGHVGDGHAVVVRRDGDG